MYSIVLFPLTPHTNSVAVLVLYLTSYLNFNEDTATALYHSFIVLCFATPLLGAIIADSLLGKFKLVHEPNLYSLL